jgi:hypothetical protein
MRTKDYLAAVMKRVNPDHTTTCEDCGKQSMSGHAIVDHEADTIKVVCEDCFLNGYRELLYSEAKGKPC